MSLSPSSLLARLDELKKWQQIHQEKLMRQHSRKLEEIENISIVNDSIIKPQQYIENEETAKEIATVKVINKPMEKNESVIVNKTKRPYLKRGSGLVRYRMKPGEQYKPFNSIQRNVSKQKDRFGVKVLDNNGSSEEGPTPLKRPDAMVQPKATWLSVHDSEMKINDNILSQMNELSLNYVNNEEPKEHEETSVAGEDTSYERANEKELRIFEHLEQRALDSSFSSTNSSIMRLLESTPQKKPPEDNYKVSRQDDLDIRKLIESNLHKLPLENIVEEDRTSSNDDFNDDDTWSDEPSDSHESTISIEIIKTDSATQTDSVIKCNCEDLLKDKLSKLDKEIESFRQENAKIKNIKRELDDEERKWNKERKKLEKELQEERLQMEHNLEEDKKKLAKEKMVFERYVKDQQNKPSKKERQEITSLKLEIENLKETLKLKETRNATTQARLRNQVKSLEKDNANLKEEIDKVSKLNAKLQVSQRANNRKPSDTKMLHEINKNLTKLTQKTKTKAKVSTSESSTSDEDSLHEEVSKKLKPPPVIDTVPVKQTENNCKHSSTPPLSLRQRKSLENNENDRNSPNVDSSFKSFSEEALEKNYERIFAELTPHRLSNNSLDSQKNGRIEGTLADGSAEITYPNGNVKTITPDGNTITVKFYNGDIKETRLLDGTIRYYYKANETWHTSYPDGTEILEFADGQTEKRFSDGSVEVQFQTGAIRRLEKDGTEKVTYPDGTVVTTNPNGDKIMHLPNGQKEIHTSEHKRREYPDGTVKILYPDGLQETRYSNGRVRLKDKNGRLLMDTDDN